MRPARCRRSSRGRVLLGVAAGLAVLSLLGPAGCGGPGPYTGVALPGQGSGPARRRQTAGGGHGPVHSHAGRIARVRQDRGRRHLLAEVEEPRWARPPGEYKVRIEPSSELLARKGRAAPKLPFASKYREYDGDTGLTATIKAEATQLEPFRLDAR